MQSKKSFLPTSKFISNKKHNIVVDMFTDGKENIWAAILNNGIHCFNLKTGKQKNYSVISSEVRLDTVFCLTYDKSGNIWVGSDKGLYKYDPVLDKFVSVELYNSHLVYEAEKLVYAIECSDDGTIWVGTYNSGLIKFSPTIGILKKFRHNKLINSSICNNLIYCIKRDHIGNLWIGTNHGLSILANNDNYYYNMNDKTGISSNKINYLYEDKIGMMWIGTDSGGGMYF